MSMIPTGLAFHIAPRALNLGRAFSPKNLFSDSVLHSINGHVAADRYYQISTQRAAVILKESSLETRMRELFALDLNPLIAMTRQLDSEFALYHAWNTYQQHVSLAVQTLIHGTPNELFSVDRRQVSYTIDPPAARNAGLCAIDILKGGAILRRQHASDSTALLLSGIASNLGLHQTVVFEVALCFEENRGLSVAGLCRMLGCQKRTLERHIKAFGLTAQDIRMASALSGATNSLWGTSSLAEIAFEQGFSDQAHMARAFHRACGLPPSVLRGFVGNR